MSPPPSDTGEAETPYDLKSDPLVNPPPLFQLFPADAPETAARDQTLVRHALAEPRSLNPLFPSSGAALDIIVLTFEPVVTRNVMLQNFWNDRMVESVDESSDHRRYTVRLRSGMRWHDGAPLTAHDVEFSWRAIQDERVPALFWKAATGQLESVRALDELTVEYVHPARPLAPQLRLHAMWFPVVPKHLLDVAEERAADPTLRSSGYYNDFGRAKLAGNGPYRLVEWTASDRIVLERWDEYHAAETGPTFERVIFKVQPDRNMALLEFRKGGLDELFLTPQQFATQTNDPEYAERGVKAWIPQHHQAHIRWNVNGSNPFFEDRRVRLAMAHSLDRERLRSQVSYGLMREAIGFFDPESWAANPDLEAYPHDLERAAALLDEAGWVTSDADGWRYREVEGEPVRFSFELATYPSFGDAIRVTDIWREDLRKIGVEVQVRVYEHATFVEMRRNHEFQAIADFGGAAQDPDQWALFLATPAYTRGRNYGGYSNPRIDELFGQARYAQSRDERTRLYREIHALEHSDPALLPLWNQSLLRGFDKRLRGVEIGPAGTLGFSPAPPPGWPSNVGPGWWVPADVAAPER